MYGDRKQIKQIEEALRNAKDLKELRDIYEQVPQDLRTDKHIYTAFQKREFELKYQQFKQLKEELSQKKKKVKKEKLDINIKIQKKWINSRIFTAEHYVAMYQVNRDGIKLMLLRKVKLVENQGYLMLENRKIRKAWVVSAEPILFEKAKFPFGKKFVAVHFVLPDFPYTLDIDLDENIRKLIVKSINTPQILHSMIRTRFFEALARIGSGPDYTMLIIGAIMGIGIGAAVGFGIANANLSHLLGHFTNTTLTHSNVTAR
ncbi:MULTISPECIES: B277 family protein [Archaea]|uniref:B277 family protein n=1 Tax=Bacteria TaxID=2 RepID=UPI003172C7F0